MNHRIVHSLAAALAAGALAFPAGAHESHAAPAAAAPRATGASVPARVAATKAALRDLWIGHVFWVRSVVDARFSENAGQASAAEQQVVANARAIADSIAPFYGQEAADALFGLLAGHWKAISGYLDATRAGSKAGQDASFRALAANANEIAAFLAGANPNLPEQTLSGLLITHGGHHVQQIQQFAAGQFEAEAKTWGAMTEHMYVIADALAEAIAKQFPDKF